MTAYKQRIPRIDAEQYTVPNELPFDHLPVDDQPCGIDDDRRHAFCNTTAGRLRMELGDWVHRDDRSGEFDLTVDAQFQDRWELA